MTKAEIQALIRVLQAMADKIASLERAYPAHDHSPQGSPASVDDPAQASSGSSLQKEIEGLETALKGGF
ncbi:MAG: hypothetical protein WBW84_05065 [Acidobacteriaceae bacterium]